MTDCIVYFVKYPEPGQVKTRLAREATPQLAAEFYRTFAADKLAELARTPGTDLIICFDPPDREMDMRDWLGPGIYEPQRGADLGTRMESALAHAFVQGYERAVLVGSDVPGLTPEVVRDGLDRLNESTAVLGPAEDGGYYLIGFHRDGYVPEVFQGMTWSRNDVLEKTMAKLHGMGMECARTYRLADMDTLDDLRSLIEKGNCDSMEGECLDLARQLINCEQS